MNAGFNCIGVDANRNWGEGWNTGGSSGNSCSETFHGPEAFSEVENRNVRDFLLANKDRIMFYNNVHSAIQLFLTPWGFTDEVCDTCEDINALVAKVGILWNGFDKSILVWII